MIGSSLLEELGKLVGRESSNVVRASSIIVDGEEVSGRALRRLYRKGSKKGAARVAGRREARATISLGRGSESGVSLVVAPPGKSKAAFGKVGKETAREVPQASNRIAEKGRFGSGLASMRRHKVKTTLVAGAGLATAAKIRSTGSGTSRGNNSFYGY